MLGPQGPIQPEVVKEKKEKSTKQQAASLNMNTIK